MTPVVGGERPGRAGFSGTRPVMEIWNPHTFCVRVGQASACGGLQPTPSSGVQPLKKQELSVGFLDSLRWASAVTLWVSGEQNAGRHGNLDNPCTRRPCRLSLSLWRISIRLRPDVAALLLTPPRSAWHGSSNRKRLRRSSAANTTSVPTAGRPRARKRVLRRANASEAGACA